MKKIYCDYSKELHDYLRVLGNDVSKLDDLVESGYDVKYIGSSPANLQENGKVAISGSSFKGDGGYLDNGFTKVLPNVFFEAFGGQRYKGTKNVD